MPAKVKTAQAVPAAGEYRTVMVGGAYLVKALLKKLKVAEVIDQALTHQPEIEASYGQLAEVVITNRLTFTPEPLVHLADWAAEHGIDRVFGLNAAWLDDDRLGAMLDGVADHQVEIWSGVLHHAVKAFGLSLAELHDDTTSVYFEGAYEDEDGHPLGGGERVPRLVEGYNKDGQRHKVQIVLSLIATPDRVPVWYHPWDGNQTDEAVYAVDLAELRRTLLAPTNAVLIGDRKLCHQETLLKFCQQHQRFLGAHPWTATAQTVWAETYAQLVAGHLVWQSVDYVSQNNARKSEAERPGYRVCEVPHRLLDPQTGEVHTLRWIFSHSSDKAAGDTRRREKALTAGEQVLRHMQARVGKYTYTTRAVIETRLTQELRQAKALDYFSYTLTGTDGQKDWQLRWQRCAKAIDADAMFDGVALLCTNVPVADWSASRVMIKYKEQVVAEQAIDFIKSPVQIRPMWLHQPRRIAGLTLLVMLATLLAALLERHVRRWMAKQGTRFQGWPGLRPGRRRTKMPTAEALLRAFADYALVLVRRRGREEIHVPALRPLQQQIWDALQLPPISELTLAEG
jgi:transposase